MNHFSFQSLFPLKTNLLKGVDPMSVSLKEAAKLRKLTKQPKPSKATLQETAKNIYLKINEPFKDLFDTDLAEALTKIPEIDLAYAKTKNQKKKERKDNARCFKNKIEGQWSKVDCDTLLATRQSFKQREFQRKSLYFESTEEGKQRTQKRKALEDARLRKKKRYSPDPNLVDFEKEGLLQEVNTTKEGEKVRIQFIKQRSIINNNFIIFYLIIINLFLFIYVFIIYFVSFSCFYLFYFANDRMVINYLVR